MTPPYASAPERDASRATRTVAVLVLIPGIPMLLASVAALVLFYLAPDRLGRLLARLPGQEVIRTLLFFAPVTLFAVVTLAILYARDRPQSPAPAPRPTVRRATPLTACLLWITIPLLLASGVAWAARFLAPGRFGRMLEALPGTTFLHHLVSAAPLVLLAIVVMMLLAHLSGARRRADTAEAAVSWSDISLALAKLAATLVLVPSIPLLLFSSVGLALYYLEPRLLQAVAARLSQATVLRLGVLIFPVALLALIFLAALTLVSIPARRPGEVQAVEWRRLAGVAVLIAGLLGTMATAVGVVGAVIWLLVR